MFFAPGWQTQVYYVPAMAPDVLRLALATSPPFHAPGDARELGVMLAPVRWHDADLDEPVGVYPMEEDEEGRRFRWTAGVACLPVDAAQPPDLEFELRAANPDLSVNPLTVRLSRDGAPVETVLLSDGTWRPVQLQGVGLSHGFFCVEVSRTWNPRLEGGSDDIRDLGVAISFGPRGAAGDGGSR